MGTKRKPDQFDCYERAEPDEPLFTLLARDPQASDLVALWAALRTKDYHHAQRISQRLIDRARTIDRKPRDMDKVCVAVNCSVAMALWKEEQRS